MLSKSTFAFRTNIVTGVLVLAPIGAVLSIVVWIWNILMGFTGLIPEPYAPRAILGIEHPVAIAALDVVVTIALLLIVLMLLWTVGLLSRNYLGKRIFEGISGFFGRVPVLRTVYSTLEQLVQTFASGQAKNFRRVVLVEYPRKGLYALAFVTRERDKMLNIYVPTTPNPTSGFYLTVATDEVKDAGISVEDALKEIISMGIVHKDGRQG